MRATDVAARAGITHRQLDHWRTRGWVKCIDTSHGSGNPCHFDLPEANVISEAANLNRTLGLPPANAIRIARLFNHGADVVELGGYAISRRPTPISPSQQTGEPVA